MDKKILLVDDAAFMRMLIKDAPPPYWCRDTLSLVPKATLIGGELHRPHFVKHITPCRAESDS